MIFPDPILLGEVIVVGIIDLVLIIGGIWTCGDVLRLWIRRP